MKIIETAIERAKTLAGVALLSVGIVANVGFWPVAFATAVAIVLKGMQVAPVAGWSWALILLPVVFWYAVADALMRIVNAAYHDPFDHLSDTRGPSDEP